ncbi:hypothetical protein DRO54_07315 [Candidatus Bathyarchaeota archaeon]|nr:MAG: hypothetical protein DRO54_07315 [Candidatus Bathyarchaeota archaeon]
MKFPSEVMKIYREASDEFKEIIEIAERLVELGYAERRYYAGELEYYIIRFPTPASEASFHIYPELEIIEDAWMILDEFSPGGREFLVTTDKEQLIKAMRLLVEGKEKECEELFRENVAILLDDDP